MDKFNECYTAVPCICKILIETENLNKLYIENKNYFSTKSARLYNIRN